jgi:hypothetical protein
MLKRLVATGLGLTFLLPPAFAADSEMFKGKTITYISLPPAPEVDTTPMAA